VSGGAPRFAAFLAAAALLAAALSACGGGDDSTSSGSNATTSRGDEPKATARGNDSPARSGGEGSAKPKGAGGSGPDVNAPPLRVSGGGSAQFRAKGGDNSIQNFGEEADESELELAAEALHGFFVARAEEDWAGACSFLSATMRRQLEQLASRLKGTDGKDCASVLHAFTAPLPSSVRRESTVVDAGSLRDDGEQAFLIYRGADKTVYAMPMKEEDGAWKVGLLSATPLG